MPQGKRTPETTKTILKSVWYEHKLQEGGLVNRKAVIKDFRDSKKPGTSSNDIQIRKVHDLIREFETQAKENPWNYEEPLYDLWGNDWETNPEEIALHFRLRRWCRIDGHIAPSRREVKWIRRLEPIFEGSTGSEMQLMRWARNYARRERLCLIFNRPLETKDLDYCLEYRNWEDPTAYDLAVKSEDISRYQEETDVGSEILSLAVMWFHEVEQPLHRLEQKLQDTAENDPDPATRAEVKRLLEQINDTP